MIIIISERDLKYCKLYIDTSSCRHMNGYIDSHGRKLLRRWLLRASCTTSSSNSDGQLRLHLLLLHPAYAPLASSSLLLVTPTTTTICRPCCFIRRSVHVAPHIIQL